MKLTAKIILFCLVMVLLGLAFVGMSQARVASKDVVVANCNGNDTTWSVTSVTYASGTTTAIAPPVGTNEYVVPIGSTFIVNWTANSDIKGWAPAQTGSSTFKCDGPCVNNVQLGINYTEQAT